jgi:membrane protein
VTSQQAIKLVKTTASRWSDHNAPRLGAALAYYTLLSMAPLLILLVAICGVVFKENAEVQLLQQVQQLVGSSGAKTLKSLLDNAHHPAAGIFASVVAIVTLLFGASGVFLELRESLNNIWDAPPQRESNWRDMVWQRLFSFGMVIALGLLLLVSLTLSTVMGVVENFFIGFIPVGAALFGEVINVLFTLVSLSILFGLIFKFVPNVPIRWKEVGIGAAATAVLFSIGKGLLALYLSTAGVGSTYGAAGSLVALVVWIYYSAQIFFFGAVFTRVYADQFGPEEAKQARAAEQQEALTAEAGGERVTA